MAELLLGAAAASTASAGTALGAVTALGTGATAATGISSTVLNILSGVATAFGVLGTLSSATAQSNEATAQALETELQSGQEQLASENRATQMRRELMKVLGDNRVAAAASGVELGGGGIAAANELKNKQQAARDTSIDRQDDDYRRALLKARASGLRSRGRDAMTAGLVRSFGQVASFGLDVAERG